jgi:hypothetical protein
MINKNMLAETTEIKTISHLIGYDFLSEGDGDDIIYV